MNLKKKACDTAWEERMNQRMYSPKMRRTNSGYISFFDGFEKGVELYKGRIQAYEAFLRKIGVDPGQFVLSDNP